jgi:DNA-binding GntR family transcriptional regulator
MPNSLWTPHPQLGDSAATFVRNMIASGELRPGDPVRPEAIGEMMGISMTPVREALQLLRVEGLVQLFPRKGFVVAPISGNDVRDLVIVLSLLAGEVAARAAETATAEEIAELEDLNSQVIDAVVHKRTDIVETRNEAFHKRLDLVANSPKIMWTQQLATRFVPSIFRMSIEGWLETTFHDHSAILDGLRSHDSTRAREAASAHVMESADILAKLFEDRISRGLSDAEVRSA